MADSPRLDMPYIAESQYNKAETHNEALDQLELTVQCAVFDRDLSAPPGSPVTGRLFIVAAAPTGAWAGHATHITGSLNDQWAFAVPEEGWQAYVQDENVLVRYDGAAWQVVSEGTTFLGLTDTPDTYTGQTLKVVRVNAGETALEFATGSGGASNFTDLGDVDTDYTGDALKYLQVNATEDGIQFATGTSGALIDLTDNDLPGGTYAGNAQKLLAVNATEDGFTAVTPSGGALAISRGALVALTVDHAVPDATPTILAWAVETYDTDAIWTIGTPTRLSVPSGISKCYLVGQLEVDGPATGYVRIGALKNGAVFVGQPNVQYPIENSLLPSENVILPFMSPPLIVAGGTDYFELQVEHAAGGSRNVIAGNNTWWAIVLISDAAMAAGITPQMKTLSDAAIPLFEVALPAGGMAGGKIFATIRASNGTDHQALVQEVTWAAVNKAGVYTMSVLAMVENEITTLSSGTLTAAWSIASGSNKITVSVTPAGSLTETTYNVYFTVLNQSPHALTYL